MTAPSHARRNRMLLVISLLLILGFSLLRWSATRIPPQPTACQANLYLLDQAITQWATSASPSNQSIPPDNAILSYFPDGIIPTCPDGYTYQRGSLALATTCPKHGVAQYHSSSSKLISSFQFFLWKRGVPGAATNATMQCRSNLLQLQGAAEQWALENQQTNGARIDTLQATIFLRGAKIPLCPAGGKYSYSYVSNFPCCTITGHSIQ